MTAESDQEHPMVHDIVAATRPTKDDRFFLGNTTKREEREKRWRQTPMEGVARVGHLSTSSTMRAQELCSAALTWLHLQQDTKKNMQLAILAIASIAN